MTSLQETVEHLNAFEGELLPLAEVSKLVRLSSPTLVKKIKRGEIEAIFLRRKYWVCREEAIRLATANVSIIRGWSRLVDVCKEATIHRNIGEAICKRGGLECELDLNGHMRIPPEAETLIARWLEEKELKKDWMRKVEFAEKVGEHPTLVDTVCRKLSLPIDHDINGFVVLSPEAQKGFYEWREHRDAQRQPVIEHGGKTYHSLASTVDEAAAFFAQPGTVRFERMSRTYYRRFSFWIRKGLKYYTINEKKYFSEKTHALLVDDLSVAEAARAGGVSKSTVKSWVRSKALTVRTSVPKRRSLSKRQFLEVLREKYRTSPVLKKKIKVPVLVLPSIDEIVKTVHFRGEDGLFGALREYSGFSDKVLEPLHLGSGLIPIELKQLIEKWMHQVDFEVPLEIHSEYLGTYSEVCRPIAEGILAYQIIHSVDELCSLVSAASGIPAEKLEEQIFGDESVFLPLTVKDLLLEIQKRGGATLYSRKLPFEEGDLVVHPTAEDYGIVTEVINMRTIRIVWVKQGTLTMVHSGLTPSGFIPVGHY